MTSSSCNDHCKPCIHVVQSGKSEAVAAIKSAVEVGYRHFDTATLYDTEDALGEALNDLIKSKLISRDDVFVTTKVWLVASDCRLP